MELASSKLGPDDTQVVVQLGLPGAWAVDSREASDHYTTKVGGRPDWPPSLEPSFLRGDESLKCSVCGGVLGLVAQVHAPLVLQDGIQRNERTLYIFGCPAPGCGVDNACWRTFRVQKEPPGKPNSATVNCCSSLEVGGNGSGPGGCGAEPSSDWWDDSDLWGAETLIRDTQRIGEEEFINIGSSLMEAGLLEAGLLEAGLLAAGMLAAGIGHEESHMSSNNGGGRGGCGGQRISSRIPDLEKKKKVKKKKKRNTDLEGQIPIFSSPVLPCFYIYFQPEAITQKRIFTLAASSSLGGGLQTPDTVIAVEGSDDRSGEAWEGEEYESDRALHVDRTYLRFKKHLDLCPEQCFRYCHGGQVLWAAKEEVREEVGEAPGQCLACGGPRVYEMQLMPPLLYFLRQAATKDSVCGSYSSEEWDWSTLVVFTCAQSCSEKASVDCEKKEGWSIIEEATVVQQEATKFPSFDSV